MQTIPVSIRVAINKSIPVIQKSLSGPLGYFDGKAEEIAIEKDQPEIGKWIILIHELIHAIDEQYVSRGLYKQRLTEKQVESISAGLFACLTLSGGLPVYGDDEVIKFYTSPEWGEE